MKKKEKSTMMKTLTIQQPWASLICYGIKDVENRSWQTKVPPGRILIHAGGKKVPKNFDLYYLSTHEKACVANLQQFGILPEYNDLPLSAIIGYVDVKDFTTTSDSIWAGEDQIHWLLENAYLFDNPIYDVKGQLGLFDYPMDENNMPPAHKVKPAFPVINDTKLFVHVCDRDWDYLNDDPDEYFININDLYVSDKICFEGTITPKSITQIEFIHGEKSMTFGVKETRAESFQDRYYKHMKWFYAIYILGRKLK